MSFKGVLHRPFQGKGICLPSRDETKLYVNAT